MPHPSDLPSLDHRLGLHFEELQAAFAQLLTIVDEVEDETELDQELPRNAAERAWTQATWAISALDHGDEPRYRRHRTGTRRDLDEILDHLPRSREVREAVKKVEELLGNTCQLLRALKRALRAEKLDDSMTYISEGDGLALMTGCIAHRREHPEGIRALLVQAGRRTVLP